MRRRPQHAASRFFRAPVYLTPARRDAPVFSTMPPRSCPDDDPRPQPPVRPGDDECCHSGCIPCVFDLYEDALDRYRDALAAWEARAAERRDSAVGRTRKPRR
ncbi:oxidoreductase-like domain-containing protein [Paraburkholderia caballeronis]|uniref:oxidoreductase-like domain-containing protein n=2 Tax=Paraburkholderia caballeronis TaxID=416943 RepID=UPI002ADDD258|nr:oxidoreductase-like domain-containing protein [Paraburkholderia caballeronis]